MVGVGPFVTLPLIVGAMGGPQAMLGWIIGAFLAFCDGLIWSELGTAYPEAGGSYAYLKNLYGPKKLGRAFSFLYAWQLLFSAPLSIASGCIGFSLYLSYFFPHADVAIASAHIFSVPVVLSGQTLMAMAACVLALLVLYRSIVQIDKIVRWLSFIVVATLVFIIVAGLTQLQRAHGLRLSRRSLPHRSTPSSSASVQGCSSRPTTTGVITTSASSAAKCATRTAPSLALSLAPSPSLPRSIC